MKKTLLLLLITLTCTVVSGCGYQLSEADISHYLQKHNDYKQSYNIGALAEVDSKLSQLHVQIGRNKTQQVVLTGQIQIRINSIIKDFEVTSQGIFSSKPVYNKKEGAIYLTNLHIELKDIQPAKLSPIVKRFLPKIQKSLAIYLKNKPIYKLNPDKTKQWLVKRFADDIEITPGQIHLNFSL
ncbi:DUF1439 domain-containing protein [Celerinatantimonas diazotrophica]|uniref:Uncharacterized protein DUF1439 n=1 Tax=Celerinatantimonas diazotrophica TaxID=412034 RepID=A0A4R1K4S1_9GAMM|nr:DUF1439 domain-containing protein [Celerinatantimonas diazotrophica]TCK58733.1 uncharacterized protein DUF1439 [Celerinatantimonas diazotrophica]CAG9297364.1 putative lipoprotein YceB [Celerinatantimonas diazotrophica]